MLRDVPESQRIELSFNEVNAFVDIVVASGTSGTPTHEDQEKKQSKEKQVLFDINGTVRSGEILALMGPSGSGKSTLLMLLAQRSTATSTGQILFNGKTITKGSKRKLGFVTQDDMLFAELTVYETLYFTACLRLPKSWSREKKVERAERVLEGLGLNKCRDTIIGNAMMRGVSGGERKRVSIGSELLINPSILLLDEPTSGLDSTTALNLMHTLRTLATGGRTVVTSIHQPSSRLFQQMDKLLLLSDGRSIYFGEAITVASWFKSLGESVPFGVSTPDHILDLACGDLPGRTKDESQQVLSEVKAAFKKRMTRLSPDGFQPSDFGEEGIQAATSNALSREALNSIMSFGRGASLSVMKHIRSAPAICEDAPAQVQNISSPDVKIEIHGEGEGEREDSHICHHGIDKEAEDEKEEESNDKWGAGWFEQVSLLTLRSIKTRRFSALSLQRVAEFIIVAIIGGLFWFQIGGFGWIVLTNQDALDIGGLLFFVPLFLAFSSWFAAIFQYPSEFLLLVKERQSGMYRLSAYYIARSLSDLPMDLSLPSALCLIMYFLGGLRLTAAGILGYWGSIMLVVLIAQAAGLFIGATVTSIKTGLTISTITMLLVLLVGGFYVRQIPIWISWMKYLSFLFWAWNLLLKVEFRNRAATGCSPAVSPCTVSSLGSFSNVIDVEAPVYPEVLVLVGMLLAFRVATYYALKVKTSFKQKSN